MQWNTTLKGGQGRFKNIHLKYPPKVEGFKEFGQDVVFLSYLHWDKIYQPDGQKSNNFIEIWKFS